MARFDSKEYTRLRDIVQKRSKRLVKAGLAEPVHFPTIKEIKLGLVSPSEAFRSVQNYYSSGSTVKAVRQTGLVPDVKTFPVLPPEIEKTDVDKKRIQKQKNRLYRQRRKIKQSTSDIAKVQKYDSYLKALQTVSNAWGKAGFDLGIRLEDLTPSQAQAFVEYMDYRFSQGDFNQRYVVDEFIQDFAKLLQRGYKANQITSDFEKFLENRRGLEARSSEMEGLTSSDFMSYWDEFIDTGDSDDFDDWF